MGQFIIVLPSRLRREDYWLPIVGYTNQYKKVIYSELFLAN
ncbi:hypothetical protein [Shewanella atlantica]|nr:hypothetical protein [Shewanella atlantica]